MDFMTPGSPDANESLPANNSLAAIAYHNAIKNTGVKMRLDISWKLDRSDPYWQIWRGNADSLRVDQDVNNAGRDTLVEYQTVLRTLDFYRGFINEQTAMGRNGQGIMVCLCLVRV
jgi:alpha-galactosidase